MSTIACAKCGIQIVKGGARKHCPPCSEDMRAERERARKRDRRSRKSTDERARIQTPASAVTHSLSS